MMLYAMLLFAQETSKTTVFSIDATTAIATASAIAGGIVASAKILVSYFRDRDKLKDEIAAQQNQKWVDELETVAKKYETFVNMIIEDTRINRDEKRERDKLIFAIQKETIDTIGEFKTSMVTSLQALTTRIENLEKPQLALPPKLITGETKP